MGFYPFAVPEDSLLPHLAFRPLHNLHPRLFRHRRHSGSVPLPQPKENNSNLDFKRRISAFAVLKYSEIHKVFPAFLPCAIKNLLSKNSKTWNGWNFVQVLVRRMQQGFVPCKDNKPKHVEIPPFQAGSDYFISVKILHCLLFWGSSSHHGYWKCL